MEIEAVRDGPVEAREIEELRTAVGWDRCEGTYEEILKRNWARCTRPATLRAD